MAPTDLTWFDFLSSQPDVDEVNFWRPSGAGFKALQVGEPFFFKLKAPRHAIGGFGFYARTDRLRSAVLTTSAMVFRCGAIFIGCSTSDMSRSGLT